MTQSTVRYMLLQNSVSPGVTESQKWAKRTAKKNIYKPTLNYIVLIEFRYSIPELNTSIMTIGIVEVMNNTGLVLHYHNQKTDVKFDVQPTSFTAGDGGYISTSPYQYDSVPWKSDGKKIIITTDNNGPQFAVCDDYYRFSVVGNGKAEQWTPNFENWNGYIMRVDTHDVKFVKYEPGLRTNDIGGVLVGGSVEAVAAFANALLTVAI